MIFPRRVVESTSEWVDTVGRALRFNFVSMLKSRFVEKQICLQFSSIISFPFLSFPFARSTAEGVLASAVLSRTDDDDEAATCSE